VWSVEVVFERSVGKLNVDPVEIQENYLFALTKVWFNLASKLNLVITDREAFFQFCLLKEKNLRLKVER
jgi:hypothetical protein